MQRVRATSLTCMCAWTTSERKSGQRGHPRRKYTLRYTTHEDEGKDSVKGAAMQGSYDTMARRSTTRIHHLAPPWFFTDLSSHLVSHGMGQYMPKEGIEEASRVRALMARQELADTAELGHTLPLWCRPEHIGSG